MKITKKKVLQMLRYAIILGIIVFVIALFGRGQNNTLPTSKIGSGIVITNTEVSNDQGFLCKYKIQETNNSSGNQDIKIDISFYGKNWDIDYRGNTDDYIWEDKPLYTGTPRIDYIDGAPCPASMDANGITKMTYSISDATNGKLDSGGTINVSTNFIQEPIPTPLYSLQRQCGQDARDFMKQYQYSQFLTESSYSTKLQACIAFAEDTYPSNHKSLYNVTTSKLLGGYMPTPIITPVPTNSPNYNPFLNGAPLYVDDGYFIDNPKNPAYEGVSTDEFNRYLQWLGFSVNQ